MESSYCCCCRRRAVAAINAKLLWTLTICGASVSILLFFFAVVGRNDEQMTAAAALYQRNQRILRAIIPSAAPTDEAEDDGVNGNYWNVVTWGLKQLMVKKNSRRNKSVSNDDRIFFHETSGRLELSFKETCAVESAALHNPQRPVEVFFQPQQLQQSNAANSSSSAAWIRVLNRYANVQVIVIDDEALYFKDSPLEDWYREGKWRNSPYRVQHMADYIRILSLHKEGGMFLDLDVLTLKPYDRRIFWNFVTFPSAQRAMFTNAMMHLERGHRLIDAILEQQSSDYDPDGYTFNGPGALDAAVMQLCGDKNATTSHENKEKKKKKKKAGEEKRKTTSIGELHICAGEEILILPHLVFHPIGNAFSQILFEEQKTSKDNNNNLLLVSDFAEKIVASYGLHFYNSLSRNESVPLNGASGSNQIFARLAAKHCPLSTAIFSRSTSSSLLNADAVA